MQRLCAITLIAVCLLVLLSSSQTVSGEELFFPVDSRRARAYLAIPSGDGPFPAVVFLHGGLGSRIGGDPAAVADALADAGFLGFAPIRGSALAMKESVLETAAALSFVTGLRKADSTRLAIVGFSRGGLLAFMSSTARRDLKAVVLLAPARGRGALRRSLVHAKNVSAPTLILVSKNDNRQADHVSIARQIHASLQQSEKQTELIIYPPWENDGHRLFFKVRPSYWKDVQKFLTVHLNR